MVDFPNLPPSTQQMKSPAPFQEPTDKQVQHAKDFTQEAIDNLTKLQTLLNRLHDNPDLAHDPDFINSFRSLLSQGDLSFTSKLNNDVTYGLLTPDQANHIKTMLASFTAMSEQTFAGVSLEDLIQNPDKASVYLDRAAINPDWLHNSSSGISDMVSKFSQYDGK